MNNEKFTFTLENAPLFFAPPTDKSRKLFDCEFNSLVRLYFRLMRKNKNLSCNFVLPTCCGAITCGELAIIMIRRHHQKRLTINSEHYQRRCKNKNKHKNKNKNK
jgi:hypothetical protein